LHPKKTLISIHRTHNLILSTRIHSPVQYIYEYCTDFCDTVGTLSYLFASYLRIIRRFLTTSTLRCSPTCGFFSRTLTYANTHQAGRERASTRKGVVMRPTTGAIASSHGAVRSRRALQRRATASVEAAATTARTARAVVRRSPFVFSLSHFSLLGLFY
jgi:hypothetical protein